MNGVLVESVKNCIAGPSVAHVHDAERWLHTGKGDKGSCMFVGHEYILYFYHASVL